MGWVKKGKLLIPTPEGSTRYASTAVGAAITSAAGAGNRKNAQIGRVHWCGGVQGVTAKAARYISYLSGAVTADAAAKLRTSIQGKTAGARTPDGTILSAGVGAQNAFSDDTIPAANGWITVDLTTANSPTLTEGQMVSVVHEIDPDNVGTTASVVIYATTVTNQAGEDLANSYSNPTWTPLSAGIPNVMIQATDGTYGWIGPLPPGDSYTSYTYNSGTSITRIAGVYTADADYLLYGAKVATTTGISAGTFDITLRNSEGVQIGNNRRSYAGAEITTGVFVAAFADGPYLWRRGETIMVSLDATSATDLTVGTIRYPNATIQAEASEGVHVGLRTYTSGAWDAVDTLSRTVWSLIVTEQFLPGLGGGGAITGPNAKATWVR